MSALEKVKVAWQIFAKMLCLFWLGSKKIKILNLFSRFFRIVKRFIVLSLAIVISVVVPVALLYSTKRSEENEKWEFDSPDDYICPKDRIN